MWSCAACGTSNADRAKFCQECGAALAPSGDPRRRLVTALFCDLVGSTELAEQMDAEVLRKVLDRYFDTMRSAIERHGGTVEKFIGDAVVGTFGVPAAHEDDALRAVRAAIEMRAAAADLDGGTKARDGGIAVRIAIHCGEVLADDGAARQGRIGGEVHSTASRLQSAAEPGDILVTVAAGRLLQGRVDLEALGPIALKGKAQPVDAYRVLQVRATPARAETPTVGRERPLAALREALLDAVDAQACVLATVLGPAGVGKSRLAGVFADAVRDRATVLIAQTPAYGDGVTFAPLVELLARASGRPSGDAEAVAAGIRERLVGQPDGDAVGDRLAQVLGVGHAPAADTSWAVRRLLEVLAAERPLVVVLEDLHSAEPPMLDLVDSVVERLHGPALVLCLARPELLEQRPSWAAGKPRAHTMTLPPLAPEHARRLAQLLLGAHAPAAVVDRICERAEGNPLYLEQLTEMLADQGLLADGLWTGPVDADVEIPATLQALLAARLDRLDPSSRLVLERASVEGRRFRTAALRALAPDVDPEEIEAGLAALERRSLIQPEDEATGRWRFGHAMVREAAYRGLSKERRAELHERLADWILEEDADRPDVDESVARHIERAYHLREELGLDDAASLELRVRAGELFANAGTKAFAALDLITTRDLLGRAATLLPEASSRRLDILPNLGVALSETGRPAETEELLSRAVDQARAAGSERDALRASIQLLSNRVYGSPTDADIEAALIEARAAAVVFEQRSDDVGLAEAAVAIEYFEWMRGRVEAASPWTLRALQRGLSARRPREAMQGAADAVGHAAMGPLAFSRFPALAEELPGGDDPIPESARHALLALAALGAGDERGFRNHDRRLRDVTDRNGLAWLAACDALVIGGVEISVGQHEAAERHLRQAREVLVAFGDIWWLGSIDASLCTAVAGLDRPREFLRLADAFEASALVSDRQTLTRRSLIRARALLLRGSAVDAEAAARRALEIVELTDLLPDQADAWLTLADVLDARGLGREAATARENAVARLRAKGNVAAIARLTGAR